MKLTPYDFLKKDTKVSDGCTYDLFTFRSMYSHIYLVEVEHRKLNVKIIKFYLKSHRLSKDKYSLKLNDKQRKVIHDPVTGKRRKYKGTGAWHFLRVLTTMLAISQEYYKEDDSVSFAFMGAPKIEEKDTAKNKKNINRDGTIKNTTRYRIYRTQSLNYFPEEKFEHIQFIKSSSYLIRNRKNNELTRNKAEKYLDEYIQEMT